MQWFLSTTEMVIKNSWIFLVFLLLKRWIYWRLLLDVNYQTDTMFINFAVMMIYKVKHKVKGNLSLNAKKNLDVVRDNFAEDLQDLLTLKLDMNLQIHQMIKCHSSEWTNLVKFVYGHVVADLNSKFLILKIMLIICLEESKCHANALIK